MIMIITVYTAKFPGKPVICGTEAGGGGNFVYT